jgi:hypothetical protein
MSRSDEADRLDAHLTAGSFRAVIVLDEAPPDPERRGDASTASSTPPARRAASGHLEPGVQPFRHLLTDTPEQYRPALALMADWTEDLASTNPNITAATYFGLAGDVSLLPPQGRERGTGHTLAVQQR